MKTSQSVKTVCAVSFAAIALLFWVEQRTADVDLMVVDSMSDAEVSKRLATLRKELTPPNSTPVREVIAIYGQPGPAAESRRSFTTGWFYSQEIVVETDWLKNRCLMLHFDENDGTAYGMRFFEKPVLMTREYARRSQVVKGLKQALPPRIITPQQIAAQKQAEKLQHQWQLAENRKELKTLMAVERKFGVLAREQGWGTAGQN